MPAGRPSKYKSTVPNIKQIEKMAERFATNEDFEEILGIGHATFERWLEAHEEFRTAIKRGKAKADREVEKSLYRRANGFEHPAEKIFLDKDGEIVRAKYTEKYAPDTGAAAFWLKNRNPDRWREKQTIEHQGNTRPLEIIITNPADKDKIAAAVAEAAQPTGGKLDNGS